MKLRDLGIKEALRIIGWYFIWTSLFWVFGYYALAEIIAGNGLETFRLGNLPVPSLIHSSNIEVFVFVFGAAGCIALGIGFYIRYIVYGEEINFKKKFNIKDDRNFSDEMSDLGGGDAD